MILIAMAPKVALAQAGQVDPSFNGADNGATNVDGADNDVRTLALQADGKIILGGIFINFDGTTANRITRINANGSRDVSFNLGGIGADGPVYKVLLQPDGKIIVAGKFNNYNGAAAGKIIRLNADGSRDNTFNTGTGFNDSVNVIRLQADGKILVGGNFTTYNGGSANYFVRLNADGVKDGLFNPVGVASTVNDIVMQTDNKIIVGMQASGFLTRLTSVGAIDPAFNVAAAGLTGSVRAIQIQADAKIVVGGIATYPNISLVRLNTDASPDASFNSQFQGQINVITLQADGKMLLSIGEYYDRYSFMAGKKMLRINTDASVDATFNYFFEGTHFNQNIYAIAVQPDGKILAAESSKYLVTFRETTSPYCFSTKDFKIRRYKSDGTDDVDFCIKTSGTGSSRKINATALQADGKLLVGGYFYSFNGTIANHIVRLNANGTVDATFNTGGSGFDYAVNAIAVQPDGKIIVGGYFSKYNGQACTEIIRLNSNGTIDPGFVSNTLTEYNWVRSISVQTDGKILIGGSLSGTVKRLNADGSIDTGFNVTLMNSIPYDQPDIYSTVLQQDGKILIGGHFRRLSGGTPAFIGRIARFNINGTRDTTFNGRFLNDDGTVVFVGPDNDVTAIGVQPDGKIIIGGVFTSYITYNTTTPVNRIARLTADGIIDPTFNAGTGVNDVINVITVLPNGKMLIAGNFTSYNGTAVGGLIRVNADGSLDNSFNIGGTGANSTSINSLIVEPGAARFYIAGDFTSYNGTGKNRIARIFNDDAGAPVSPTTTVTICASEVPYNWNGNNYSTTGVYTASVVHPGGTTVDTLILTVGAGTISGPNRACQYITASTNAVYNIVAPAGSTITWSVSVPSAMSIVSGQGTNQVNIHYQNTFVSGGIYAHVVNAACSLNVTRSLTVSKALPAAPGGITASNSSICSVLGTPNTITYSINKVSSASSYIWTVQAGTTTITHPNGAGVNDTTITVAFAAGFTNSAITVQSVNDCGNSSIRSLNVTRNSPGMPAMISGPSYVCDYLLPAATTAAAYSVTLVAGVTYNWTVPAGTVLTGQGTNSITLLYPAGFTTGTVSVTASNGCGTSAARSITVKASVAGTPGAITTTNVSDCPNRQYTYSIAAIPVNATSVNWVVPAGGTIVSGQGTTSITVSYTTGAITGYVSVKASNTCGISSPRKIAVSLAACPPATPFAKGEVNTPPAAAAMTSQAIPKTSLQIIAPAIEGMDVKVFPNPSVNDFNLQVITSGKEMINVRLFDIAGRFISERTMAANETAKFGAALKTGVYIIEVRQGNNVKTTTISKF